jgi:hypothetical protein
MPRTCPWTSNPVVLSAAVEGVLAHPDVAAQVADATAGVVLLEHGDDLLLGEAALSRCSGDGSSVSLSTSHETSTASAWRSRAASSGTMRTAFTLGLGSLHGRLGS